MSRKLASVQRIEEIKAIAGADRICAYRVNSWWVVDQVGGYSVGDLVVYCEVDSWIPTALAPFLSKGQDPREYNGVKGERLRTVKLRGQVSQGLLLPTHVVAALMPFDEGVGQDVTEFLGIQKWEAPVSAQLAGVALGNFPTQVPKTDEDRIQGLTRSWSQLSQLTYEVTEKLEGSSMTVGLINDEFVVCSRNLSLKETEGNSLWEVARRYQIKENLRNLGLDNIVLQGEIVGPGIQGNHYALAATDFYVFGVYDIQAGEYLAPMARWELVSRLLLKHVPVISPGALVPGATIEDVLAQADGASQLNPQRLREGLVFKQVDGQEHWKAVSNQYLLKTNT
jgi:RNA ligase (TIGR02306 family)